MGAENRNHSIVSFSPPGNLVGWFLITFYHGVGHVWRSAQTARAHSLAPCGLQGPSERRLTASALTAESSLQRALFKFFILRIFLKVSRLVAWAP